jgi:hypothetical protein
VCNCTGYVRAASSVERLWAACAVMRVGSADATSFDGSLPARES